MKKSLLALLLVALPLGPAVMADGLPDLGESARVDLPPYLERRIGVEAMREIRAREPTYIDDPELVAYLNRVARRLIANSDDPGQEIETFVLRDPTLNAFAMPGGFIGVHTGLILAAQSESELAGVMAHETAHVTQHHLARQVSSQSEGQIFTLLSLAVAVLAARSNSDVAQGALIGGQAAAVQNQLSYSRDFEREADRLGLQRLEKAGFDARGMESFFERLEKFGRLYDNSAPAYLRTHPLTIDRMSDMANRIQSLPYRQIPDSLEFQLVRAKLKSQEGTPQDAVSEFRRQLDEGKYASEAAVRYGLAQAYLRAKNYVEADREVQALHKLKATSSMFDTLVAELRLRQGMPDEAVKTLKAAQLRYPQERAVVYGLATALLEAGQADQALQLAAHDLQTRPGDERMYGFQARAYAQLGRILEQHRAQAEAYYQQGRLLAAIEQLHLAQKAPDGDFYARSQVDARLRELKAKQALEMKERR